MAQIKTPSKKLVKLALAVGLFMAPSVALAAKAADVVQGFSSKKTLQPGIVVTLDSSASKTVKEAPANNSASIYGVVVDPADAPITLVGKGTQTFVATSGNYPVLVSVADGAIKSGDYISMSSVSGIAAKAGHSQTLVLGKATSSFNGSSNVVTNNGGSAIGRVYVDIAVGSNPLATNNPNLPGFLKNLANSLANKPVPVIRVYTALLIFVVSLLAAITILYSGVHSSLISIGRNPLSRKAIFRGMYKVVFTGLGVFIIGLAGVYLLLKI